MKVMFQQAERRTGQPERPQGGKETLDFPCVPRVGDEVSTSLITGVVTRVAWSWGTVPEYRPTATV